MNVGRCVGTIDSSSGISHSDRIHCFHLVRTSSVRSIVPVYRVWFCINGVRLVQPIDSDSDTSNKTHADADIEFDSNTDPVQLMG